jgi:uncharacterized protein YdcH (DUF465 family)
MPLFTEDADPLDAPQGAPPSPPLQIATPPSMAVDPATQGAIGLMGAGLQQTPFGAAYVAMTRRGGAAEPQPGYNAFEDPNVKGTPAEYDYHDQLMGMSNPSQTAAFLASAMQEEEQRRALAVSPGGTAVSLLTGLADPTMYVPVLGEMGAAARGASLGVRMARDAAAFGVQSAASQTITNAFRSSPLPFSAEDVATAAVFGGFIGAGASFLEPAEKLRGVADLEDVRREFAPGAGEPPPAPAAAPAVGAVDVASIPSGETADAALSLPPAPAGPPRLRGLRGAIEDEFLKAHDYGETMPLSDLKAKLAPMFGEDKWNATLLKILQGDEEGGGYGRLGQISDPKAITPEMRAAEFSPGGEPYHLYAPMRPEGEPAAPAAPAAPAGDAPSLAPAAAGAAASDARDMRLSPFLPDTVRNAIAAVPGGQRVLAAGATAVTRASPTARVFLNGTRAGARAMGDLAETSLKFAQAKLGVTASSAGTVPVDRLVRMQQFRLEMQARDILSSAFTRYRGTADQTFGRLRAYAQDLSGQNGGLMDFAEFKRQVYLAGANADAHAVPDVAAAARAIRESVFKPVERLAQDTKGPDGRPMLGDALAPPAGDKSFVPRIWNKIAIAMDPNKFDRIVADWLQGEQATKAATKDRLADLQARHETLGAQVDKLERRIATAQQPMAETETRADEVGQSVRRGDKRADVLADREGEIQAAISELQEFRAAMAEDAHGPDTRARLADLDEQIAALKGEARPVSKSEVDRLERQKVKETFEGAGPVRHGAQVALGLREFPEKPSALQYFRENGGINDTGGDVAHTLGRGYTRDARLRGIVKEAGPGMLGGNTGARSLDQWGEKLAQDFPEAFPEGRASPDEVLDLVHAGAHKNEPDWFTQGREPAELTAAREHAASLSQLLTDIHAETGSRPTNLREFAAAIKDVNGVTPAVIKRQRDNIEALIEQGRIKGARVQVQAAREEALGLMSRALASREAKEKALAGASGAAGERGVEQTAVKGRVKILEERQARQKQAVDWMTRARDYAEDGRAKLRAKMEDELRAWKGDASADAVAALKARDEAVAAREAKKAAGTYQGRDERLTSADGPVDRAVKNILASDRDLSPGEILDRAREIRNRINTSADGRLPYDIASGGPAVGYPPTRQQAPGSLNSRDFAIPTHLVSDFVHTDMEHVVPAYLRTLLPELHLTQRFGDPEMTEAFKRVNEEYDQEKAAETNPKKQLAIDARRQAETRDLAATRDRIRGVYGMATTPFQANLGRVARSVGNWNVGSMLGTSVFNRFQDMANATARRGMMGYMRDGFIPYFKALAGVSDLSKAQLRAVKDMQIGVDTQMGHLASQFADVNDNHMPGNRFERGLRANASLQMVLTGHGPWTDMNKQIAASAAMQDFLRTAGRMEAGKGTADDLRRMAHAGINPEMAGRISRAFENGGHTVVEGEKVPNVADWQDRGAADAFQAACQKDADIAVITPGMEKPLFLSDPVGSMLGQFKGFSFAAQERILLSNMQEMDGRTLWGFLHMMAMGMLSYRAYTLVSGQPASERPQDWIKEAVVRAGMLGWMADLNSSQAKLFGGRTDAFNLIGADRMLTRRQTESWFKEMLGPTAGNIEAIAGGINDASHGTWDAMDTHRIRQFMQMQNHFLLRRLFDQAEDGFNKSMGITPMNRYPTQYRQN